MSAWLFWLIVTAVLLLIELMTGMMFGLCLSIASLIVVGLSFWLSPFLQGVVFAALAMVALVIWARVYPRYRHGPHRDDPAAHSEGQHHLLGQYLVLSAPLAPMAQIRVGDSFWLARSQDGQAIEAGHGVQVVAIEGTVLVVVPCKTVA